ncbi:MAG: hypothetical protein JXQ30_11445 [Spirochaetes bacterium]|nr:hypothetical protein [Spirochaetota bacterium]
MKRLLPYSAVLMGLLLLLPRLLTAQQMEPEEPEIVLPRVVLEIEDLSVETVRTGLPKSEELPSPWREHPLPEPGELRITEASFAVQAPDDGAGKPSGRKDFVAEAIVGTGTPNHFFSRISLYKYGGLPEGSLFFQHEMFDGFSENPPGSGYNYRDDTLKGTVRFGIGDVEMRTTGSFSDTERGLQGQGNYYSKLNRKVKGTVAARYEISEQFHLSGELDGWGASQLLVGTPSGERTSELVLSPQVKGELLLENVYLALTPRVSYRNVASNPALSVTRVGVKGDIGITIGEKYRLDGGIGWFYSDPTYHLLPFHLAFTLTQSELFTLQLKGGYEIDEYDLAYIFEQYRYSAVGQALCDSHGWFFDAGSRFTLSERWTLSADVSFKDQSGMITAEGTPDPVTGLFPTRQKKALRLGVDVGARWTITSSISARFGIKSEILDNPEFFPRHKISADIEHSERSGRYGAGLLSSLFIGENEWVQSPVIDLYGFYRPIDYVRFSLELSDLLLPIAGIPRYSWYPYIERGFGVTLKAQINF